MFLFTFTSFGVVLILGGSNYATLEVAIYTATIKLFRLPIGAVLALVQIGITFVTLILYARLQERATTRMPLRQAPGISLRAAPTSERLLLGAVALGLVLVLSPLVALVARSILPSAGGLSMDGYLTIFSNEQNSFLFVSPLMAIRNSLAFGLATVAVAVPLGVMAAYALRGRRGAWWRSPLDALYMLPLGVSAVTLGLGYLIGFSAGPIDLRATWVPTLLAHILVAYPFVLRVLLPTLRSVQPQLPDAARVLGAGRWRLLWHLELPLLSRPLVVGAVFAFAVSMGEFGATLLLNRPEYTTMPVAIYRYLGRPGATNLSAALAMSALLVMIAAVGFLLIERLRFKSWGEF